MKGVREVALTYGWLLVGAALTGCAAQSGRTSVTTPGVFASIDIGAATIDVDTLGNTLEVEEDTSPSVQVGLGYQASENLAVEIRGGDLGAVEFRDGRELTYQQADFSGLLMWRHRNASLFGRLGVGTFFNGGDFEVELESPVHAVLGGGVVYHALPNLDLRFSVTAHGGDAAVGSAGLVWRFGGQSSVLSGVANAPSTSTFPVTADEDDGFEPIAPVGRVEAVQELEVTPITTREETSEGANEASNGVSNNGSVSDEKPLPTSQSIPEPVVSDEVTAAIQAESAAERVRLAARLPEPEPALTPAPGVDAVNISEKQAEELFVVDTLLDVRPLQFGQGVATLLDTSLGDISEVSDLLIENPELRLQVESHAAPVGNAELNMLLSRRRALTVIRLLVDQGVDAVRLRPRAFGDTAPIADADSIDENDRVEFRIR